MDIMTSHELTAFGKNGRHGHIVYMGIPFRLAGLKWRPTAALTNPIMCLAMHNFSVDLV
jgi:hypothetical protein